MHERKSGKQDGTTEQYKEVFIAIYCAARANSIGIYLLSWRDHLSSPFLAYPARTLGYIARTPSPLHYVGVYQHLDVQHRFEKDYPPA